MTEPRDAEAVANGVLETISDRLSRAAAATGDDGGCTHWEVGGPYPSVTVITCVEGGTFSGENCEPPRYEPVCYVHDCGDDFNSPPPQHSLDIAEYIAASGYDIQFLLAEVKRLRAENERLRAALAGSPGPEPVDEHVTGDGCERNAS
jgi:hypothetical protein